MLPKKFPAAEKKCLREILERRRPELLIVLDADEISLDAMDELCDLLVDEFSDFGLEESDKPNVHGLEVEHLIDLVRR